MQLLDEALLLGEVKRSIVVEVSETGEVIGSLQGSAIKLVSQTNQVGDSLFFGSPFNKYLGRIKLSDLKASKPQPRKPTTKSKDEL